MTVLYPDDFTQQEKTISNLCQEFETKKNSLLLIWLTLPYQLLQVRDHFQAWRLFGNRPDNELLVNGLIICIKRRIDEKCDTLIYFMI